MRSSIPTDDRHLKKEELSLLVGQGFDVDSRSRILSHLGAGCPVCGKMVLRELAEGLLDGYFISQRHTETIARRGITLVQNGYASDGFKILRRAIESLPEAHYPRLNLEIRHFQAAALVQLRSFSEALDLLLSGQSLYEKYHTLEPLATRRDSASRSCSISAKKRKDRT